MKVENMRVQTPRGDFKIKEVFTSEKEAQEKGYGVYFTMEDGNDIFTKHLDEYHCEFAILKRC